MVWVQTVCKPGKHSLYHYETHNPVLTGTIKRVGEKISSATMYNKVVSMFRAMDIP